MWRLYDLKRKKGIINSELLSVRMKWAAKLKIRNNKNILRMKFEFSVSYSKITITKKQGGPLWLATFKYLMKLSKSSRKWCSVRFSDVQSADNPPHISLAPSHVEHSIHLADKRLKLRTTFLHPAAVDVDGRAYTCDGEIPYDGRLVDLRIWQILYVACIDAVVLHRFSIKLVCAIVF